MDFQTQVQQALCNVVRECKNFKVRINAALAFSIPANRGCYGNPGQFLFIWDSLLVALENAEQVSDFAEYRYRDSFTEQVLVASRFYIYHLHCEPYLIIAVFI